MIYVLFLNKTENVIKKEQVSGKKRYYRALKNSIFNAAFYSVTSWEPVYFSKV